VASGREVVLRITANVTSLRAGMLSAAASVKDFEGQVVQVAKVSNETQRIAGKAMLGVGVAAAAGLALAVRSAVQFEQRMANVATISGDVEKNFDAAGDAVLEMSGRLGVGANELAEGLYDVASAGFQGAAGMQILEVAAVAAQAGLSTTAVAAKAITGALNAYGLSVSQASDVSDIFFQTVNLGIVTFEELAQNVGDFMGTANVLGVSLDKAAASFATITLAGVPAAEAATSLNAVMTQMLSPSVALTATMEALGYESGQAMVNALGLHGTLQLLRNSTGDNTAAFAALFPEVRAMRGAIALTAQDGATYNRVAGEITDKSKRAGAAAEALAIQQRSLGGQLKIAKEQILALAIGIGQSLLPVLRPVVGLVQNVATGFAALGGGAQTGTAVLGVLAAGVFTIGGAFLLLAPKIAAAVKWFQVLRVTAPLLAASLQTVTLAMGAIGIALIAATFVLASYGAAKKKTKAVTDDFVAALKDEKAGIKGAMDATVAKMIVDKDLDKQAAQFGISVETLTDALGGNKAALTDVIGAAQAYIDSMRGNPMNEAERQRVIAAQRLIDALGTAGVALDTARDKVKREDEALKAAATSSGKAAAGIDGLGDAAFDAAGYMDKLDESQKKVLTSLQGMVDLSDIYVGGQRAVEDAEKEANRAAAERIRDGARAQSDAMETRHTAERKALDAETTTGDAARKAHDQRVENLTARQEKEKEAAETTVESEGKRADAIEDANTRSVLSLQSYLKLISDAGKARLSRQRNLAVIKARGATAEVLAELAELPDEYAGVINEIATSSDAAFAEFVQVAAANSASAVAATQAQFDLLPPALEKIGGLAGEQMAKALRDKFLAGLITVKEIIDLLARLQAEQAAKDAVMVPVVGVPGAFRPAGGGPTANINMRAEGHYAQIAPAGSWRIWAEPETGGEAYIPLAYSKRSGSMALVAQVASAFGAQVVPMAAGGTWGVPAYSAAGVGGGGQSSNAALERAAAAMERASARRSVARMENHFHEKIDPLHVARKISWELDH
jgi:TP901 family phage tail tape measure protein